MSPLILYLLGVPVSLMVLAFLLITAYLHYVHWKYSHIPQPKRPSFYLGHLPDMTKTVSEEQSLTIVLQQWLADVQSSVFVVFFMNQAVVVVTDPESVKTMMPSRINKDMSVLKIFINLMGERFMGNSILTIPDYETWKPRRQLYDPAFKKSYLKTLLKPFNEITDDFLGELEQLADGESKVPMKVRLGEFSLDVISKVAFGSDFTERMNSKNLELKNERGYGIRTLVSMCSKGIDSTFRQPGYQYLHPFKAAQYRDAVRSVRAIGRDCIKTRIKLIESGEQVPNDILTHILQMPSTKESVGIEELVDDFVTFYIAGQETTASMLTFALVQTLLHPNVLERLQSEVDEVLRDKNYVSPEDLEQLEYTEQVLKETLRLCGPFSVSTEKECPPEGVTVNGYFVPGGTQLMASAALMGQMPEYFDEPDTFNPSRFNRDNKQPSSFVYFPFGLGHRSCIGKHFAMMEAKIVFSRLFHTFKIKLPEGYEMVTVQRGIVQTKDDVLCTLESRH